MINSSEGNLNAETYQKQWMNTAVPSLLFIKDETMNYQKIYYALINKRRNIPIKEGYVERHHVIPRCMGGDNTTTNIIKLTAREHFFAHALLIKIYPKNIKLLTDIHYMSNDRRHDSKKYHWVREQYSLHGSPHKGKTYEEIMGLDRVLLLKKIRSIDKTRINIALSFGGEKNPMHHMRSGKSADWYSNKSRTGYATRRINGTDKHSEETKKKIRKSCRDIGKKKLYVYTSTNMLFMTFNSIKEAAVYFNRSYTKFSSWIKHNPNKLYRGFYLRYYEHD